MPFDILLAAASALAGALAAVTGFGIGSILTPVLAARAGTKLAVAAIAIPHFVGTFQRFWMLRRHVDRRVLLGFGIASAVGGLAGALLHTRVSSRGLTLVFAVLVTAAGVSQLSGWMERVRWGRRAAWVAGVLSGGLGGLVGNQGGIRTAALLGFDVPKEAFVATATAIGLFVDVARMPVYFATEWRGIAGVWPWVLVATAGVVVGTAIGRRVLGEIPPRLFRPVVAVVLVALGIYMGWAAMGGTTHAASRRATRYVPRTRALTVTTVPLLVKEEQSVLPFLKEDFAPGGVLAGKEVYAFSPSTLTVVEGDTIRFTFVNPEDDVHSFVLPDLVVPLAPQKDTTVTYVARHAGIFPFVCSVPAHRPMMSGQLVVLAPEAVAGTTPAR